MGGVHGLQQNKHSLSHDSETSILDNPSNLNMRFKPPWAMATNSGTARIYTHPAQAIK